jgi:GNAT superfamily N-acetyltransferase
MTTLDQTAPSAAPEVLVPWLDRLLDRTTRTSVGNDLPLFFVDDPRTLRRVMVDAAGRPVAHAAARLQRCAPRPAPDRPPRRDLSVAFVGAVAVDPAARRRGLGRRVVEDVLGAAALRGADLAVLWSEADDFYRSMGFVHAGAEYVFCARRRAFPPPAVGRVRPYRAEDLPSLMDLHEAAPALVRRDERTWRTLLGIPGASAYVLERRGAVAAYGVVGRAADLAGTLHEWGVRDADLPALVGGIMALRRAAELFVLAPGWSSEARALFNLRGAETASGPLCMAKPLRPGVDVRVVDDLWFTGLDSM